jgi:hypothetical protein
MSFRLSVDVSHLRFKNIEGVRLAPRQAAGGVSVRSRRIAQFNTVPCHRASAGHWPGLAASNREVSRMSAEELPTITSNEPGSTTQACLFSSKNASRCGGTEKVRVLDSPGFSDTRRNPISSLAGGAGAGEEDGRGLGDGREDQGLSPVLRIARVSAAATAGDSRN